MKITDAPTFDDLAKLVKPGLDIERFRPLFWTMLDLNGAIPAYTVGFHISLDDEGDEGPETAEALDVINTFSPTVLYSGKPAMQARLQAMGRQSYVFPFFEDGGFAVVLKVPAIAPDTIG